MEPCIHHLLNAAFELHDSNPTILVQTPNDDKRATNKGFNNDVISFFKSQYPHTNFSKWSPYNCSKISGDNWIKDQSLWWAFYTKQT